MLTIKARRYADGTPLPVSVADITDVLSVHPNYLGRDVLDGCIFAIDDYELEKVYKKQKS